MKRAATLLVWLALAFGFPQVLIGLLTFYAGGWWFLAAAFGLTLMPFAPLILAMHPGLKERAPVAVTVLASLALNAAAYWTVLRQFALD